MADALELLYVDDRAMSRVRKHAAFRPLLDQADLPMSAAVVESWTGRIRDAFAKGRRAVRPGYFDEQIERALTVERRHQLRSFDGNPCVRGHLTPSGDASPCLVYMRPAVTSRLPLSAKCAVRALAIVHVATDELEAERTALWIVAIARRVALP